MCGPRSLPALVILGLACALARPALAADPTFVARVDRNRAALGEAFVLEVTLSLEEGRVEGYRRPEFRGLKVLGEEPSQSTRIEMGGGGSFMETVYTWRYELEPLQKGAVIIGPARVRVGNRDLQTSSVTIQVVEGQSQGGAPSSAMSPSSSSGAPAAPPPQRRGISPFGGLPFNVSPPATAEPAAGGQNFLRVVPSKTKVYVGEQVTVEWFLYLTARQDRYQTVTEPRADGFWSEELPVPNSQQGLQLSRQEFEGNTFLVAPLLRRALFPLQAGTLNVTAMESEISQVDFFGSTLRSQRLRTQPLTIEVIPLPRSGQPRGFDPAAVGRLQLNAKIDRERVQVGEAVTLTVAISGRGNVRKLPPPPLPRLDGWKVYDPKVSVAIQPGDQVNGTKTVEYLLLPERSGTTVIPPFTLPVFDPEAASYTTEKTAPLRVEVIGEAGNAGSGSRPGGAGVAAGGGGDNVLGIDIRPLRGTPTLRRDYGAMFYRSSAFAGVLVAPPLLFGLTVLVGRIRDRMQRDTEGTRRRRRRRLVRQRLGAAETHLQAGRTAPFFIEIDRVLREFLSGKLGVPVTGLNRDELRAHLAAAGLDGALIDRTVGALEACDRARFAPGAVEQEAMRQTLDEAGEIILQIERLRLREVQA